jgi:hypothetical protein
MTRSSAGSSGPTTVVDASALGRLTPVEFELAFTVRNAALAA